VSKETGLVSNSWTGDASFFDVNQDGWPDVYVLNMHGSNHLFINHEGKTFTDETKSYFPLTPPGAMGIKWFDYDNDGKMDLYLTDMHSDMIGADVPTEHEKQKYQHPDETHIFGNVLFHNLGPSNSTTKFEEISNKMGVEQYWPWGPSIGDLNADGFEDIFVAASMSYPFRYGINSVLLNNRGEKFLDSEFILGVEPRRGGVTRKPWYELDCSGADVEHPLCQGQHLGVALQFIPTPGLGHKRTGKFVVTGTLGTRSAVIFDLDGDGDLDIVTNEHNSQPQVLISNLSERKAIHFVKVALLGHKSNRNGLGATVRLFAGGKTYLRYVDGKSGYLSQSVLPLYFGLGDTSAVDKIEVEWPSGTHQVVSQGLSPNTLIRISEPK
jgi:hypothetical protein